MSLASRLAIATDGYRGGTGSGVVSIFGPVEVAVMSRQKDVDGVDEVSVDIVDMTLDLELGLSLIEVMAETAALDVQSMGEINVTIDTDDITIEE